MKKLIAILALVAVVASAAFSYAWETASLTLTIPAATNYGTIWDSLGNAKATSPFTFLPLEGLSSKSGYFIAIYCDDSTGSPDSVIFLLQRNVLGGAADIGVTGVTNGPGATSDVAAGKWVNVGARLGAALGINNSLPITKFIPADSLVAYPIVPGEEYRIAAVGGKAAGDHYTAAASPYVFNVYVDGATKRR